MYDIVFLHPPSSFGKLTRPLSGICAAVVPSSDLLAYEPVGMISMAWDLRRRGYRTKIFNVGRMVLDLRHRGVTELDEIDEFIAGLSSRIYAIDLHWAAHAPGAIDLARMVKTSHPDAFVILGGITASRFHDEILRSFPFIDRVVVGEVDGLIHEIVDGLLNAHPAETLPNIACRHHGEILLTERKPPIKEGLCYFRGEGAELIEPNTAFARWNSQAFLTDSTIPLIHGCSLNCTFCGGSRHFYKNHFHRNGISVTPIADVVSSIRRALRAGSTRVSLFGDARLGGEAYWRELTDQLAAEPIDASLYVELFSPADKPYMQAWRRTTKQRLIMTFSPESADPHVRRAQGRHYSNECIAEQVGRGLDLDIRIWLGFIFPLPEQDYDSVVATQAFIDTLSGDFGTFVDSMFEPFLFVDPGSPIFDAPEKYGYTIPDRSLKGLIRSLTRPHWSQAINFHTKWMSKDEIIKAMFMVGEARNELEMRHRGPARHNAFHNWLLMRQKPLVDELLALPADSPDEVSEQLIDAKLEAPLRQMGFSVTRSEVDFGQLDPGAWTLRCAFPETAAHVARYWREASCPGNILSAFERAGLLTPNVNLQTALQRAKADRNTEDDDPKRDTFLSSVATAFAEAMRSLGVSVALSALQAPVHRDWKNLLGLRA